MFAAAKAYSKRGQLLSRQDLQAFAEARDLDELVTRMRNAGGYGAALSGLQKPYTAQRLESVLRGRLAEIHHSIVRMSGGSKVLRAYYTRFLVWNLKLVLKGKAAGKTQDELEPLVNLRAEELVKQRDTVLKALAAKDLEEAVAGLAPTAYGADAAKAAALYAEGGDAQVFDAHFDRVWVGQLSSGLRTAGEREAGRLAGMTVDFYNLMGALRGKFWGLGEEQIRGLLVAYTATAPRETIDAMIAAGSAADALGELAGSQSSPYSGLVPRSGSEMDDLSGFERAFEMAVYARARGSFTRMFSPATSVGIAILSAFEVRNLASIAFAVEQGMPARTVMSRIIMEA